MTLGLRISHQLFESGDARALREYLGVVAGSGVDRVCVGDHVSFHGGRGFDGLVQATAVAALCDVEVQTAVYLLPLRHPVPVARQVSSLAQLAGGGFVFGVGVGGEDPNEVRMCGVDPATRGRRMDEALPIVRRLVAGEQVSHHGEFFDLDDARILPVAARGVPVVVGGRSPAALRRAGRFGDGYLGVWVTPERMAGAIGEVQATAASVGRVDVAWRHGIQMWCGFGETAVQARRFVAAEMEALYRVPFERFERYTPVGEPADIAAAARTFVAAGCRDVNLIAVAASPAEALLCAAEVRRLLEEPAPA
ncbi:MAG: LLM class flavin-dependent oxidoreductase [Actinomycetota bacterium]|nr:LLM class flavin-dependent oxidoreductase [Actinomycetota bacterium]